MTTSLTGVAAKLERLPKEIVDAALARFDVLAKESAARVIGSGTMRIHARGGKRYPVTMRTKSKVYDRGDTTVAFVNGTPAGPWVWLEDGTRPHEIGRPRRGQVIFLQGERFAHPIRGPIVHPGSRGRQAWTRAVAAFARESPDIAATALRKAVDG